MQNVTERGGYQISTNVLQNRIDPNTSLDSLLRKYQYADQEREPEATDVAQQPQLIESTSLDTFINENDGEFDEFTDWEGSEEGAIIDLAPLPMPKLVGLDSNTISSFTLPKTILQPVKELQEKQSGNNDEKKDVLSGEFQAIYTVQQESDRALGIQTSPTDLLKRSYIIPSDIWKRRKFQSEKDIPALEALREQIRINHMTNIGERLSLIESTGTCILHNQDIHPEGYLKESLGQLMQRGVDVRAQERILQAKKGLPVNPDGPREEAEGKAWEKIKKELMQDLIDKKRPVGRTALWYSPKSFHADSSYYGNFVDTYTVREENGKRFIDWQRLAVDWDNEAFTKSMTKYAPQLIDILKNKEGTAEFEVIVKEMPIFVNELPDFVKKKGMTKADFEEVFRKVENSGLIRHYINLVYTEPVDWLEIAKTFNTILHAADYFAEHTDMTHFPDLPDNERRRHDQSYDVRFLTSQWGIIVPETKVGGGACPPNTGQEASGFTKKVNFKSNTNAKMLSGTVGQFGISSWADLGPDGKGPLNFHCEKCGGEHSRPLGGYLYECPINKQKYEKC